MFPIFVSRYCVINSETRIEIKVYAFSHICLQQVDTRCSSFDCRDICGIANQCTCGVFCSVITFVVSRAAYDMQNMMSSNLYFTAQEPKFRSKFKLKSVRTSLNLTYDQPSQCLTRSKMSHRKVHFSCLCRIPI